MWIRYIESVATSIYKWYVFILRFEGWLTKERNALQECSIPCDLTVNILKNKVVIYRKKYHDLRKWKVLYCNIILKQCYLELIYTDLKNGSVTKEICDLNLVCINVWMGLALCSGCVMDCHATARGSNPVLRKGQLIGVPSLNDLTVDGTFNTNNQPT